MSIQYAEVPGAQIQEVIWQRLMPALEGTPIDAAILSMLTFSTLLMKPDTDIEVVKAAVQAATETIVLHIAPPTGQAN